MLPPVCCAVFECGAVTRLRVEQALAHPWLASLHDPADEPACPQASQEAHVVECWFASPPAPASAGSCSLWRLKVWSSASCCQRSTLLTPASLPPRLPAAALQQPGGGDCGAHPAADTGWHCAGDVHVQSRAAPGGATVAAACRAVHCCSRACVCRRCAAQRYRYRPERLAAPESSASSAMLN
jgi:hypothetical protein